MLCTRDSKWAVTAVLLLVLAAPVGSVPAPAPESPLALIPAEAPIVIQLHGIERTRDRLLALVKNALPDLAKDAQANLEGKLKEALDGRSLKGLDPNGPIFVVVLKMPEQGEEPQVAIVARVTRYEDFRNGILKEDERKTVKADANGIEEATLDKTVYFVDRKSYAIVTPIKDAAVKFTKEVNGLDRKLGKEDAQRLLAPDVSVYVDVAAINKQFGDQIRTGKQLLDLVLQQAANAGGAVDKNTLEMSKLIIAGLFQLLEDSRSLIVSAEFRPEGLAFGAHVQVGADTSTNGFLKESKPTAIKDLGTLPAGQMIYYALQESPHLARSLQSTLQGIFNLGDDESSKGIKTAYDQIIAAGPRSWLASFNLQMQGVQVMHFQEPAKAVEAQLKLYQALKPGSDLQNRMLKEPPEIKIGAEDYQGFKLTQVRMVWDLEKMAQSDRFGKVDADTLKKLLGEDMKVWFGTNGKVYVQIAEKDWANAKEQLERYLEGKEALAKQQAFLATRKHLPAETSFLMLMDLPLFLQEMSAFMQAGFQGQGLPIQLPAMKADPKKASFLGTAFTLQPERGSFEVWLPATTVAELRRMAEPVLQMLRGAN